jgi:hypothetical protein
MIDTDRLTPAERALYEALFPNGIAPNVKARGARVSSLDALWVFAAICFRTIGTLPTVAVETLDSRGYSPCIEFELWKVEAAPIRRERWARQRWVWRLMVLVYIRRAALQAEREQIVALLRAEGERAAKRRARRRLAAIMVGGLVVVVVAALVIVVL